MITYTVKSGDSLSKIAVEFYGTYTTINGWDPVKALASANNISNANFISPGQQLIIPQAPKTTSISAPEKIIVSDAQPKENTGSESSVWRWLLGATLLAAGTAYGVKKWKQHRKKK